MTIRKGRIECQFKTYGGIIVAFIEVKIELRYLPERLDFIAQVIAECDGTPGFLGLNTV